MKHSGAWRGLVVSSAGFEAAPSLGSTTDGRQKAIYAVRHDKMLFVIAVEVLLMNC